MSKARIEILRKVTITRDESAIVEVDVPDHTLDDPDELFDWVERELGDEDSQLSKAVAEEGWDVDNEDEDVEYDEVNDLDPEDV